MGEAAKTLEEVLGSIYVSDLIHGQRLLAMTEGDFVLDTAKLMSSNKVSSVPVFKTGAGQKLDDCLGIVDFSDIVSILMELREKGYNEHDPRKLIWAKLGSMSVKDAIKFNAAKYVQISVTASMLEAVDKCGEFAFRRMLAVDEDDQIVGVVSPSEMIKQIMSAVGSSAEKTLDANLETLSVGVSPVITVNRQQPLTSAFTLMNTNMVSAVGVVDPKSHAMQASVSVTDVCTILDEENSGLLKSSVWKFITHKKDKEIDAVFPYFSVKGTTTLRSTMERLLATNVHHLYVVDEENRPVKMVGFADVCRGMLTFKTHKNL